MERKLTNLDMCCRRYRNTMTRSIRSSGLVPSGHHTCSYLQEGSMWYRMATVPAYPLRLSEPDLHLEATDIPT
jgi:hypothetical protein